MHHRCFYWEQRGHRGHGERERGTATVFFTIRIWWHLLVTCFLVILEWCQCLQHYLCLWGKKAQIPKCILAPSPLQFSVQTALPQEVRQNETHQLSVHCPWRIIWLAIQLDIKKNKLTLKSNSVPCLPSSAFLGWVKERYCSTAISHSPKPSYVSSWNGMWALFLCCFLSNPIITRPLDL